MFDTRGYALVNKSTGEIDSTIRWGDDRNFPSNYPVGANLEVKTIEDVENSPVKQDCFKYDHNIKKFVEFTPDPPAPQLPSENELLRVEIESLKSRMTNANI